jgi:hypothetical protein
VKLQSLTTRASEHVDPLDGPAGPMQLLDWTSHGCRINTVSLEDLLAKYQAAGFLYPAKRERLARYMPAVADTWERTLAAGDELRRVITFESDDGTRWGSVDAWRSSTGSWTIQHLVANGGGVGSRASVLTAISRCWADPDFAAAESWFRPSNPFPDRIMGASVHAVGEHLAARADYEYIAVAPGALPRALAPTRETTTASRDLLELTDRNRGHVYTVGAALAQDPGLEGIDTRYRCVGLRRYRRIWLAESRSGYCAGAALAHRGPLGLNFSFLENRCDIIVDQDLPEEEATDITVALLVAASEAYDDFAPNFVPAVVPEPLAEPLLALGGSRLQTYAQIIWLRSGLPRLVQFYDRVIRPRRHRSRVVSP